MTSPSHGSWHRQHFLGQLLCLPVWSACLGMSCIFLSFTASGVQNPGLFRCLQLVLRLRTAAKGVNSLHAIF